MSKRAYRINELVSMGPFGRTTLYALMGQGKLPTRKLAGVTFVLAEDWGRLLSSAPAEQP
jgi:predicted DNA-binding transcriptional regulator AlpA